MSERTVIGATARRSCRAYAKLRFDKPRDCWIILAPERVFELDAIAHEVVALCDGERTVGGIVDILAGKFARPPATSSPTT